MQQMQWFGSGLEGFYKQKGLNFYITDSLAGRRLTGHAGQSYGLISDMYFDRDENSGVILIINGGHYRYTESGFTSIEETIINKLYNQLTGPAKNGARRISVNIDYLTVNGRKVVYPVTADIKTSDTFSHLTCRCAGNNNRTGSNNRSCYPDVGRENCPGERWKSGIFSKWSDSLPGNYTLR
ncbi:hypothetical protein Psch_00902 [Pelotomaculum schinkii]|uniref:Uncharacterized protein n=1 Tax=Pelotomaculum schinkii TaxID=78350 RepID=A0A4Y7RF04_9FIRM|nr:hypothetical protein [Pelotomaculum schinkii]TEB07351.1 hypothetical protein Psch_00902 [Pelotomaculum schinkii]